MVRKKTFLGTLDRINAYGYLDYHAQQHYSFLYQPIPAFKNTIRLESLHQWVNQNQLRQGQRGKGKLNLYPVFPCALCFRTKKRKR